MTPETLAKIEKEAAIRYPDWYGDYHDGGKYRGYIAGATAWAERVEELEREKSEGIAAFLAKLPPESQDELWGDAEKLVIKKRHIANGQLKEIISILKSRYTITPKK